MTRFFLFLILALLSLLAFEPGYAQTQQVRLALVIANSDYNLDGNTSTPAAFSELNGFVTDLRNPRNDGRAMRAALTRLGFEVTFLENASRERMGTQLALFGARIDQAPEDALIVIYYSGHAIQVDGQNYLIPAGARIPREQDISRLPSQRAASFISTYAISANEIFRQLRTPSVGGMNLVVLDSCRDNPWEQRLYGRSRSVASRGLAEQAPRLGRTLVAYSTSPGDVAADGAEVDGANSPYTGALLRWLSRPGYTVLQMLNNVGREVASSTGQIPWTNNAPVEDICLAGCVPPGAEAATSFRRAPESLRAGAGSLGRDLDTARRAIAATTARDWSALEASRLLSRFLSQAPFSAYLSLAHAGDSAAEWVIGAAYSDGVGIVRDAREARAWLQRSADRGNARSQNGLGTIYAGERIYGTARIWYLRSAEQGNAIGQNNIGQLYENGTGVARDYSQALSWYQRAADQGSTIGQVNLGRMYEAGRGVPIDYGQALLWYRRAADQGAALAQVRLGLMYENGRGVARDSVQAVAWYRRAADQGDASGQAGLGQMYRRGLGVAEDHSQAVAWYRRAADQGHSMGQNNLGYMYENGLGVMQDYAEALAWYRRAAAQGDRTAENNLGSLYESGHGVAQDYVQAAYWYRKASDQGLSQAQYALGVMLYEGRAGVAQNRTDGLSLVRRSAAAGNEDAGQWLMQHGIPLADTPPPRR